MYPLSFGFRLVELYQAYGDLPRRDLRCKIPTEPSWTDRELFMHMCDEDLWLDAKLPDVLLYVARNKHLNIPPSWESCMVDYINHAKREVTRLNYIIIYIYIYQGLNNSYHLPFWGGFKAMLSFCCPKNGALQKWNPVHTTLNVYMFCGFT